MNLYFRTLTIMLIMCSHPSLVCRDDIQRVREEEEDEAEFRKDLVLSVENENEKVSRFGCRNCFKTDIKLSLILSIRPLRTALPRVLLIYSSIVLDQNVQLGGGGCRRETWTWRR